MIVIPVETSCHPYFSEGCSEYPECTIKYDKSFNAEGRRGNNKKPSQNYAVKIWNMG